MDFQNLFYALGSVFLIFGIVLLIAIAVMMWKMYQSVLKAQESVQEMKDTVVGKVNEFVSNKPSAIASSVGLNISTFLIRKVKNMISGKK